MENNFGIKKNCKIKDKVMNKYDNNIQDLE